MEFEGTITGLQSPEGDEFVLRRTATRNLNPTQFLLHEGELLDPHDEGMEFRQSSPTDPVSVTHNSTGFSITDGHHRAWGDDQTSGMSWVSHPRGPIHSQAVLNMDYDHDSGYAPPKMGVSDMHVVSSGEEGDPVEGLRGWDPKRHSPDADEGEYDDGPVWHI